MAITTFKKDEKMNTVGSKDIVKPILFTYIPCSGHNIPLVLLLFHSDESAESQHNLGDNYKRYKYNN